MIKAVVGANWGDEGKGKITDMLAQEADVVVRFQGGANAGHTIVNDYGKFALHTLPSGVFSGRTTSVIGNGVALVSSSSCSFAINADGLALQHTGRISYEGCRYYSSNADEYHTGFILSRR